MYGPKGEAPEFLLGPILLVLSATGKDPWLQVDLILCFSICLSTLNEVNSL